MKAIFDRFKEFETLSLDDPRNRCENRIKILITNMFSNKASGWAKSKEEKKIQTKDEIAKEVLK